MGPTLLAIALLASLFAPRAHAAPPPAGPWEKVSEKNGVRVEWRKVQGTSMKEIRAVGEVDAPAERLFAALTDVPRYPRFMPPAIAARALKKDGATGWFYLVIDPPFVRKRDYCVKIDVSRLEDGRLQSAWRAFNEDEGCPAASSDMVRMRVTEGRWILTPRGPARTHLDYQAFTDPSGSLPAWAVNRSTARAMREMFVALVKGAEDKKYDACRAERFGCE